MIEKFLNSSLFGRAINAALNLDPQAREKLASLEGRRISIHLDLFPSPWVFKIENQSLKTSSADEAQTDVRLTGTLGGFMRLFKSANDHVQSNHNDKLYIEGDLHAAQAFQSVMKDLKPDFYQVFTEKFGAKIGGFLADALKQIQAGGAQTKMVVEEKFKGFFNHQEYGCVSNEDFDQFANRIQILQHQLLQLEHRLKDLEN